MQLNPVATAEFPLVHPLRQAFGRASIGWSEDSSIGWSDLARTLQGIYPSRFLGPKDAYRKLAWGLGGENVPDWF
jgi:hypothetical protein